MDGKVSKERGTLSPYEGNAGTEGSAKWHPHAEHRDELASFFSDLCLVIGFCQLSGFHITVREKDLAQFNVDHGTELDAYSLAAWALLLQVARTYPGEDVVAMF